MSNEKIEVTDDHNGAFQGAVMGFWQLHGVV
jgi:hypothetical protein